MLRNMYPDSEGPDNPRTREPEKLPRFSWETTPPTYQTVLEVLPIVSLGVKTISITELSLPGDEASRQPENLTARKPTAFLYGVRRFGARKPMGFLT